MTVFDYNLVKNQDLPPVRVNSPCPLCGNMSRILMNHEDYKRLENEKVPVVFGISPETSDAREALITGTCKQCWDSMFPPDREEDDDSE